MTGAPKPKLVLDENNRQTFNILNRARKVALLHGMNWKCILRECLSGNYLNMLNVMNKYFEVTTDKQCPKGV